MLVQDILDFLDSLKKHGQLISCDTVLFRSLTDHFYLKNPQQKLDLNDIAFVESCFVKRWQEIVDDKHGDYTLHPEGVNQLWIELAKKIAPLANKNYLNVLIPTITNTRDFNNLSPLSETVRLENFYLGHDRITLFRKRGLCEHLITVRFKLSTCRDIHTRTLSPLTIDELYRLQSGKHPTASFNLESEDGKEKEHFTNFWDFLKKKTFPRLQEKGHLPFKIMPDFRRIVILYFHLKKENADFSLFREQFIKFLDLMYRQDLENINFLYGDRITYNDKEHYLLDWLLLVYQTKLYELDKEMLALNVWLDAAEAKCIESKSASSEKSLTCEKSTIPSHDNNKCFSLILSMLTTQFSYLPLTGTTICLWDKTNAVPADIAKYFAKFNPALDTNNGLEIGLAYKDILRELKVASSEKSNGFFSKLQFPFSIKWYNCVLNENLEDIGVCWFEPERILAGLLALDRIYHTKEYFNLLDGLICTCAQSSKNNTLLKEIRINILLTEYLSNSCNEVCKKSIESIQSTQLSSSKSSFFQNCSTYLLQQLSHKERFFHGYTNTNFSTFSSNDDLKLVIPMIGLESVRPVIDSYKVMLKGCRFEPKLFTLLHDYLTSLLSPILTIQELNEASKSADTLDFLNAPT